MMSGVPVRFVSATSSAADGQTAALLNRLIVACHDGARAHTAALDAVTGVEPRGELEDGANRRLSFARELSEMVRELGGMPSAGGSTIEDLRVVTHWLNALLVRETASAAYGRCARVEAHAERLYDAAMKRPELTDALRFTLTRQHDEISIDCAMLLRRSMGG